MHRIIALFSLLLFTLSCRQKDVSSPEKLLRQAVEIQQRAVEYLVSQRAADGGWHSTTHGILKGGAAYTPYLIDALQNSDSMLPDTFDFLPSYRFLLAQLDTSGAVGRSGPYLLEYPVYATAYFLKIWPHRTLRFDTLLQPAIERYLLEQQFNEKRGISPDHPAYGAWGFGEENLPHGEVGHVDLSHTRRVLEALHSVGYSPTHPCWSQAGRFLERLQNEDGGFCSSTYTLGANKADDHDHTCASYATATADGLLAVLALPVPDSARIHAAARWLFAHEDWDHVSGIPPERPGDWERVLFYYHLSVRAQAYARLAALGIEPENTDWAYDLLTLLRERQADDGSFHNPWGAPNKEDDPLLATALVVRALQGAMETLE